MKESQKKVLSCSLLATLLSLSGCSLLGTNHILQQQGNAVATTKEIKGAHVIGPDSTGKLVPGIADIPAGAVIVVPAKNVVPDK